MHAYTRIVIGYTARAYVSVAFLAKLLSSNNDSIIPVFNSLAINGVYETSIVQQCRMLETALGILMSMHAVYQTLNLPWIF